MGRGTRVAALAALLAFLAALPLPAAAGARPRYGGTVRVLLPASPSALDPARASGLADLVAARALGATLLELPPGGAPRPALLEASPEVLAGGRAVRLRLAAGLRFQDGTPLGAGAVAASLTRLAGPGSASAWLLAPVDGWAALREGRATGLAGLQVTGERELRLVLAHPFPALPWALAAAPAAVVRALPQGALAGTGPFRPAAPGPPLLLAAAEGAATSRPFADAVTLAGTGAGAASRSLGASAAELAYLLPSPPGAAGVATPPLGLLLATVSRQLGPAAPAVREALAGLDRADLARVARGGAVPLGALLPASLLPPGPAEGAPPVPLDGRPHVAPEAWRSTPPAEAAHPPLPRRAPPPARLRLAFPEEPSARSVAARIQLALHGRGTQVALEPLAPDRFAARLAAGTFEAALVPLWLVSPSPALALAQVAFTLGGGARAATALEAASAATPAGLASLARRLEEELLAVPLCASGARVAARPGVEGVALAPDGTLDLGSVWLAPAEPAP